MLSTDAVARARTSLSSAIAGSIGGLVATLAMSVIMLGARLVGLSGQLPPERIARDAIAEATGRAAHEDEEHAVAALTHVGFGTFAGTLYGLLTMGLRRIPTGVAAALGATYATAIWLVSYQGWVPALHIMPPASQDRPGRVATMLVAHWVYGIGLGIVTGRMRDQLLR
ncbi:MAG: hypothetical protein H0W17_04090 [Chloroflexi bacterium]|nr:hypothetical protein [Chloroflexota bacterium]